MKKKRDLRVRKAKPSDLNSMLGLLSLLFSIEKDFFFNEARQCRGLVQMLEYQMAEVLVAESRNRVIGMCTGQLVISTAEGGYSLLVEDLVVEPSSRGQRVGRILLDKLERWAVGKGATRLQLLADKSNKKGLGFYTKNGWQRTNLICLLKKPEVKDNDF